MGLVSEVSAANPYQKIKEVTPGPVSKCALRDSGLVFHQIKGWWLFSCDTYGK